MADQARIDLQTVDPLTDGQIDRIREILNFDGTAGYPGDTDLIARIGALAGVQNQRLKAYILDWDEIPIEPVHKSGGAKGIDYKTRDHRAEVRDWVRILLGYGASPAGRGGIRYIGYGYGYSSCPVVNDLEG